MSIAATRQQRRQLARENAKLPLALQKIPRDLWPMEPGPHGPIEVFRSREFMVQVYEESGEVWRRLSIHRTTLDGDRWTDGISWDDLQRLKAEAGYADADAVEVYPAQSDVVNVANIRHLWIMNFQLGFAWRKG